MIEAILPPGVAAVDTREDWPDAPLHPDELAGLGRPVASRRLEYLTARACAHRALERLGYPDASVPAGPGGAPRWPPGVVGSITHCRGYRGCAVAAAEQFATLGIDAEPHEPLNPGVLPTIARPEERRWIDHLHHRDPSTFWDRLLFSAKESVYKAWFPLTGRRLGFEDATVTFDVTNRTFHARLLTDAMTVGQRQITAFTGRWLTRDHLVLTAIAVRRPQHPQIRVCCRPSSESALPSL